MCRQLELGDWLLSITGAANVVAVAIVEYYSV
jgi:hypothetical protein